MRLAYSRNYELIEDGAMKIICRATEQVIKEGFNLMAEALEFLTILESDKDEESI